MVFCGSVDPAQWSRGCFPGLILIWKSVHIEGMKVWTHFPQTRLWHHWLSSTMTSTMLPTIHLLFQHLPSSWAQRNSVSPTIRQESGPLINDCVFLFPWVSWEQKKSLEAQTLPADTKQTYSFFALSWCRSLSFSMSQVFATFSIFGVLGPSPAQCSLQCKTAWQSNQISFGQSKAIKVLEMTRLSQQSLHIQFRLSLCISLFLGFLHLY